MLPVASRYVDEEAFETYADNDGQEIMVTKIVPVTPEEAFNAWVEHAWKAQGTHERKGTGRGLVGARRTLQLGITEEIVNAGAPRVRAEFEMDNSASLEEILSISYEMRGGVLHLESYLGYVRFIPTDATGSSTLVAWSGKMVPSMVGHVFCCGGSILRLVFRSYLNQSLESLAQFIEEQAVQSKTS